MALEKILNNGYLYNIFGRLIGRKNSAGRTGFYNLPKIEGRKLRVLDIGCGPGSNSQLFIGTEYYGFDFNKQNITMANEKYKNYPNMHFVCADVNDYFNAQNLKHNDYFDLVYMTGVMHHLTDDELRKCLSSVKNLLRTPSLEMAEDIVGELRTQDGVFLPQNSAWSNFLLKRDRGKFVRTEADYLALLKPYFPKIETKIFTDLNRIGYPIIIFNARGR